jgi:hypothetical protein
MDFAFFLFFIGINNLMIKGMMEVRGANFEKIKGD